MLPASPRSVLSVPGSSEKMLAKALTSAADEIFIDLEDAVAPGAKADARATTVRVLSRLDDTPKRIAVRVNAPGSPWAHEDLIALAGLPSLPHSVVVPKVESAGDLAFVDRLLAGVEGDRAPIAVQALIESAAGLTRLTEICAATDRLRALIIGYADLGASLGRGRDVGMDRWRPAQEQLIWAARTAGLAAVDGPYLGVAVDEGFTAAVHEAAQAGFDAKWVIHPRQIDAVNAAFSPSADDIDWAREVVDALEAAEGEGIGVIEVRGRMLDEAVAVSARRLLSRARLGGATPANGDPQ